MVRSGRSPLIWIKTDQGGWRSNRGADSIIVTALITGIDGFTNLAPQ
jgi:hypothetical protein